MRAFVAIDLPPDIVAALEQVQDGLPVGRAVDADTLHLTLAFLDNQPEPVLAEVHQEIAALRCAPFEITLAGLGTFGGRMPKVLWAGVLPSPPLSALQEAVVHAARRGGVTLERRRFRPHVTLARFGAGTTPGQLERLRRFLEGHGDLRLPVPVRAMTLYESILTHDGPVHEPLEVYPLAPLPSGAGRSSAK